VEAGLAIWKRGRGLGHNRDGEKLRKSVLGVGLPGTAVVCCLTCLTTWPRSHRNTAAVNTSTNPMLKLLQGSRSLGLIGCASSGGGGRLPHMPAEETYANVETPQSLAACA
jgi:hypothetical protein